LLRLFSSFLANTIPYLTTNSCKSIQPISLAKSQAYIHLAAAKSVARLGTLKLLALKKLVLFQHRRAHFIWWRRWGNRKVNRVLEAGVPNLPVPSPNFGTFGNGDK
jgi:hypothetical protein